MPEPVSTGSDSATTMLNALQKHNARAVLGLKTIDGVIEIEADAKPIDAANLLWEHNLLAVPIWDRAEQKYVGFFDIRDVLTAVIKAHQTGSDEYDSLLTKALAEMTVQDKAVTLRALAADNTVYVCTPNTSLDTLCEMLSQPDCHRVLVCVKEGTRCFNMITRSTLVRYLSNTIPRQDLEQTLDESGIEYRKEVVSIEETASAREAFELIDSKGLYGIAVVGEEDGALVGNTSARDIKLVALNKGNAALDLEIMSYLAAVRQDDSPLNGKKAMYPACHVRETSTMAHVLNLLAKTGYHRVFVTDEYVRPVGVISDQDILRHIVAKSKQLPRDVPQVPE